MATPKDALDLAKSSGAEFVDLRFCDLPGVMQHFSMPIHERRRRQHRRFDEVDPAAIGAQLSAAGFTVEEATTGTFAGRPAKVLRATRS